MLTLPIAENSSTCLKGIDTCSTNPRLDAERIAKAQLKKCIAQIVVANLKWYTAMTHFVKKMIAIDDTTCGKIQLRSGRNLKCPRKNAHI